MQDSEFKFAEVTDSGFTWWRGSTIRSIRTIQITTVVLKLTEVVLELKHPFTQIELERLLSLDAAVIGFFFECICGETRVSDSDCRMCPRHHAVCTTCWKRLAQCPQCQARYIGTGPLSVVKVLHRPNVHAVGFRYASSNLHVYWSPLSNLTIDEQAVLDNFLVSENILKHAWEGELRVVTEELLHGVRHVGFQYASAPGHVYKTSHPKFTAIEARVYLEHTAASNLLMRRYSELVADISMVPASSSSNADSKEDTSELLIGSPIDLTIGSFENLSMDEIPNTPPRPQATGVLAPETPPTMRLPRMRTTQDLSRLGPLPGTQMAVSSSSNANRQTRRRIGNRTFATTRDRDALVWNSSFGDRNYIPPADAEIGVRAVENEVGVAAQDVPDVLTDDDADTVEEEPPVPEML